MNLFSFSADGWCSLHLSFSSFTYFPFDIRFLACSKARLFSFVAMIISSFHSQKRLCFTNIQVYNNLHLKPIYRIMCIYELMKNFHDWWKTVPEDLKQIA